jgi:hypothetical protein
LSHWTTETLTHHAFAVIGPLSHGAASDRARATVLLKKLTAHSLNSEMAKWLNGTMFRFFGPTPGGFPASDSLSSIHEGVRPFLEETFFHV